MTDIPKLTKAQKRELNELAGRDYRSYYVDNYKPIIRLLELGYVDRQPTKYSATYAITDRGRAALDTPTGQEDGT